MKVKSESIWKQYQVNLVNTLVLYEWCMTIFVRERKDKVMSEIKFSDVCSGNTTFMLYPWLTNSAFNRTL
jgi:hypothetical protein